MIKRKLAVIILFSFAAFAAEINAAPETKIYNQQVREAYQHYASTLTEKRNDLVFENGDKANDCNTYLKASKASAIGEGVNNQIIKGEYLVCDVLSLLGKRQFIIPKIMPKIGERLATQVDLRSFPSSVFPQLNDRKFTLSKLTGKLTVGATAVSLDSVDWHYTIEVVATADINNNGKTDWIFWLVDEARMGNYRGYQTLVAYDVGAKDTWIKPGVFPKQ